MTIERDRLLANVADQQRARFFGKYRGLVTEVGEGADLGYIRARVPEVYHDQDSPWAVACVPFAGDGHGLMTLPEVGDGVWMSFEAGDISKPIWDGFWWACDEHPEPGSPTVRVLATSNGHKLVLDEERNEIRLEHGSGPKIVLTDSEISLEVGGKKISITSSSVTVNGGSLEVT